MRITFDTRQDSYEEALGVLRRAYGRHGTVRREQGISDSQADGEATVGEAAKKSPRRSATGRSRKNPERRSANGDGTSVSSSTTATKGRSKKKAVPRGASSARGRSGAPKAKVAANTAPPGQSEAIRAWA